MTWSEVFAVVSSVLFVLGWFIWTSAIRLDRLHRKVAASRLALDAQLLRRATAAVELAISGELEPASSVLVGEAAHAVLLDSSVQDDSDDIAGAIAGTLGGMDQEWAQAESDLSATLRWALEDSQEVSELQATAVGGELLGALSAAWFRAQLARRFHNEAVAQAARVRRAWYVRLFRLAGHAPMPRPVDLDDGWPPALARVAASSRQVAAGVQDVRNSR